MCYRIIAILGLSFPGFASAAERPNVLLVMTDDQGFGDLGASGNPLIRTPNMDAFAKDSVRLKNFYVCPVCSPTRSSLMTGRYNYRTGIVDTYLGRSLMRTEEVTIAERLGEAGYRTGLFGKWHLGDNYPMRPEDQGFQETLWGQGGGLAQPADPPEVETKTAYFDPLLRKNGKEVKTKGYCTDVFTDAAIDFIKAPSEKPFFTYIAYNCPHGPFQVPDEYAVPYRKLDLTATGFPKIGQPWATGKLNVEEIARAYGMIENIDSNFGKLLKAVPDNTIVIFLTDNGPGGVRFNAGLRNRKGTVYEGGIRVPCYIRWKGKTVPHTIDVALAHIDITPTIADLCDVKVDEKAAGFDGRSFRSLLLKQEAKWPERTLFFQWHRGDVPERGRAFAARGPQYKLVQSAGVQPGAKFTPRYELFDIVADPFEEHDLAAEKPEEVAKLKAGYDTWFEDVTKPGFEAPRIIIGSTKENPVRLSRQDWRGPNAGWAANSEGHWQVKFERAGRYKVTLISKAGFTDYQLNLGGEGIKGNFGEAKSTLTVVQTIPAGDRTVSAKVSADNKWRGIEYLVFEFVGK